MKNRIFRGKDSERLDQEVHMIADQLGIDPTRVARWALRARVAGTMATAVGGLAGLYLTKVSTNPTPAAIAEATVIFGGAAWLMTRNTCEARNVEKLPLHPPQPSGHTFA